MFLWAHREAKVQKIYLSGSLRVSFGASAMFGYIVLSSTYVYVHISVYLVSLNTGLCGCSYHELETLVCGSSLLVKL